MRDLQRLEAVIRTVREVDGSLPIQHLHFLLIVAREHENGGVGYDELERLLATTNATVSRITRYLGTYMVRQKSGAMKDKGKGWVETRPDPTRPKFFLVTLSKAGQKFCKKLSSILNR